MKPRCVLSALLVAIMLIASLGILIPSYYVLENAEAHSVLDEFSPNLRINNDTTKDRSFPVIAVQDGTIYVVWQDMRYGTGHLYLSKSMNNGTTFSQNHRVDSSSNAIQKEPDITVSGKDVFIVWEDYRNGLTDSDIYLAHSSDGGDTFDPSVQVNTEETSTDKDWNPSVAIDRTSGYVYVSWIHDTKNNTILAARSIDAGTSFQTVTVSDSSVNSRGAPDIAVDNDGKVYVVWNDGRNGIVYVDGLIYDSEEDVFIANSTDHGMSFGINTVVNDPITGIRQTAPSLAIDGNNDLHVAWTDERFDFKRFYIMYARSSNGSNFGPNVLVNSSSPIVYGVRITDHQSPRVAVDQTGNNVTVAWQNNRGGLLNNNIYYAKSTDGGLSFEPANSRFGGNYFIDSSATYNGVYNDGEAVILDDGNDVLDPGVLNGSDSPDKVVMTGKANLKQAENELKFYDADSNGSWDFEDPIVLDSPPIMFNIDETTAKAPWDNTSTGNSLSYLWHNDSFYYTVNISEVMGIDGFDTIGEGLADNAPVSSVVLEIIYKTSPGYSGTSPVLWSLEDGTNNTLFVPSDSNGVDLTYSAELYPLVDNVTKIRTMNVSFVNNDINPGSQVKFDKLLVKVKVGFGGIFDVSDDIVYNGTATVPMGTVIVNFAAQDRVVFMDSDNNGQYSVGEPLIKLSHDLGNLTQNDTVLQPPNNGRWTTYFNPFPLNDDLGSAQQFDPSIAIDEWEHVYAVWKDYRSSQPNIYYTDNVDDTWPPEVEDVQATNSEVKIIFSEPVDIMSFTASFSIDPQIDGTWSWDPYGHVAILYPSQPLYPMTSYGLQITTDLMDISGNHMLSDYQYDFRIQSIPIIIHETVLTTEVETPIGISARIVDEDGIINASVFYRSAAETNFSQGNMSLIFGTYPDGYWTHSIPPPINLTSIHYYIEAKDVLGNKARVPNNGYNTIVVVDIHPPVIKHVSVKEAIASTEISIEAAVFDDHKIDKVLLYVKPVDAGNFNPPVPMDGDGNYYSAKVKAGDRYGIMKYYIRAVDAYGNDCLSPSAGTWVPYEVNVHGASYHLVLFPIQTVAVLLILWQRFKGRKLRGHETW